MEPRARNDLPVVRCLVLGLVGAGLVSCGSPESNCATDADCTSDKYCATNMFDPTIRTCIRRMGPITIDVDRAWVTWSMRTNGDDPDPDGYCLNSLRLDPALGTCQRRLPTRGFQTASYALFEPHPGVESFELTDVAGNCQVQGDNPREVRFIVGDTTLVVWNVRCQTIP